MTKSRNIGAGSPNVSRSMKVSYAEAERLMRQWWPDRTVTVRDMAERLGISRAWLTKLAQRWSLPDRRGVAFRVGMPVRVRDMDFIDAAACAAHFGLHVQTVRSMVCRGDADKIGLSVSRAHANSRYKSVPLILGPFHWDSHRQAAAELGLRPEKISLLKKQGRTDELYARAMAVQSQKDMKAYKARAAA
ncbi:hypothetical protein [Falsirhodobacter sp. 20TX0035]|uniref:hypothetical protein n=1 Tax=Falsirhodobacter sp. 20TX0035 TaxID=3022019 RepID=UPI00232F393B|nr:hypothetical protein [Falsirhodobacter sp. 20TX0035]MDB6454726.1 hypothetical protein [Falsirhodobacter sp. 20TX0035]